ncbi:DEKNAAC100735 [Brettanomyces naardenensis]|uniref:DEKNAAC100735 n=1 Tax=Brettanomyces naardenensis TaxID=13370 RepID=A0A448YG79_BRENA|nr:DEKNAAC100735 [Brettanomyces naardenensis]
MKYLLRTVLRCQRGVLAPLRNRAIGVASPISLSSQARFYAVKSELYGSEYVPEGKVVVDAVTGEKKLVKPMTIHTDLPEHPGSENRKTQFWTFVVFAVCMSIAVAGIFQYERISCAAMNATMYYLRRSQLARQHLGNEITYSGIIPYISGDLNTMQGRINIKTKVEGDHGKAVMHLKAGRSQNEKFRIDEWTLVTEDGVVLDLLHDDDSIILDI